MSFGARVSQRLWCLGHGHLAPRGGRLRGARGGRRLGAAALELLREGHRLVQVLGEDGALLDLVLLYVLVLTLSSSSSFFLSSLSKGVHL